MISLPQPPSDAEWLAIGQALTFATALLAWVQSLRNAKAAKRLKDQATDTQATIQRIEIRANGTLIQLLAAEKAASLAQGKVEGIASERSNPQIDSYNYTKKVENENEKDPPT